MTRPKDLKKITLFSVLIALLNGCSEGVTYWHCKDLVLSYAIDFENETVEILYGDGPVLASNASFTSERVYFTDNYGGEHSFQRETKTLYVGKEHWAFNGDPSKECSQYDLE